jgi:predicted oxidoreductase
VDALPQAIMDEVPAKFATLFEQAKSIDDEHVHGFSRDRTIAVTSKARAKRGSQLTRAS